MAGYIGSKASVVSSGAERKKTFEITTSTTSLTGLSYTVDQVHVFHNGVRLVDGTDYTATNGTSITLTSAAESGDEVVVVSYATFQTSDTVSASTGGTFAGDVTVTGNFTRQGTGDTDLTVKSTGTGDADASVVIDGGDTGESAILLKTDGVEEAYLSMTGGTGGDLNLGTVTSRNIDIQPNNTLSTRFVPSNGTTTTEIARFYANNTHCGGVSAINADMVIGQGSVGLLFEETGPDRIVPAIVETSPAVRDAAISLGGDGERFKDLYLSGGVYLGGTGSANKLDDVEEGTFTPTISGGLQSGGAASGNYYKVGKLVHVVFRIYRPADLSSSTDISIGNLPFSASGVQSQLLNVEVRYANIDEKQIAGFSITNDSASGAIRIFADTSGDYDALQHVALTSNYSAIGVSGTYQTA
jgi:hypothetical protein